MDLPELLRPVVRREMVRLTAELQRQAPQRAPRWRVTPEQYRRFLADLEPRSPWGVSRQPVFEART